MEVGQIIRQSNKSASPRYLPILMKWLKFWQKIIKTVHKKATKLQHVGIN